jgi:hypothetical protein
MSDYYDGLVKQLRLPAGFSAPRRLTFEDIVAAALTRDDLDDDVRGINSSLELIAATRGGGWPEGPVAADHNYVDLVWHEQEFREGTSFAYVVRDAGGQYLGCLYLYPVGRRTPLSEELMRHDVDASWWVTREAHDRGYYEKLYRAARHWIAEEFPFRAPHYSNAKVPDL